MEPPRLRPPDVRLRLRPDRRKFRVLVQRRSLPLSAARGFSLTWYQQVAADPLVWQGLRNTLVVGVTVSIIATASVSAAYTDFRQSS